MMTTDERIEALTVCLELESREIQKLRRLVEIDAENIRAPARVAEDSV
jgi:hypothetical protein